MEIRKENIIHARVTTQIKNITLLQMIIKRFILVRLPLPILHFIKTNSANNYILIGARIMKIGLNPELIAQGSGPAG